MEILGLHQIEVLTISDYKDKYIIMPQIYTHVVNMKENMDSYTYLKQIKQFWQELMPIKILIVSYLFSSIYPLYGMIIPIICIQRHENHSN